MKILRVGFVGAGFTSKIHSNNLVKLENVELSAIYDPFIERAQALKEELKCNSIKIYDSFEKMLEEAMLDALYVCIPPFAHNGEVEIAASKGIHIFIEKPIALTIERGKSMASAVKKSGVISQVGYHTRNGTAVKKLKAMIDDGTAGVPTLFDGRYDCNHLHSEWWRDKSKSGGQVFEQVIHTYDMSMFLLGDPETVTGFTSNMCHKDVEGYTVEDTSASVIRFKSGALATIAASNCAVPMEWNNRFVVICENVTAVFENPNKAEFIYTNKQDVTREYIDENVDMYYQEDEAFISAIRGNENNCCSIYQGLKGLYIVDGVMKSSELGGQPINVDIEV